MRIAIFTFALVVRIVAIEWSGAARTVFGDAGDYLETVRSLCEQGVYPERGNLPFFRAPGLPFFIAAVTACEPSRIRLIKYSLAAVDSGSVLLIASLALLIWGRTQAALIAAIIAALHPFFWGAVTDIRGEPLFMFLLLASIRLMLAQRPALAGIGLAMTSLTRPTSLLCIPLFALFILVDSRRRGGRRPAAPVVFLVACALALAPWTIRNVIRFGEPIIVNDAGGFNLWRGTHPEMLRIALLTEPGELDRAARTFETETVFQTAQRVDRVATTPASRDRAWRKLALENVRRDPLFAARATGAKLLMYWRPWLHPGQHPLAAVLATFLFVITLYAIGAGGMAIHRDRLLVACVLTFFIAMWAAHLPYVPTIRLRTPLVDPLMIAFAAGMPLTIRDERLRRLMPFAAIVVPFVAVALLAGQLESVPAARVMVETIRHAAGAWWAIPLFVALYALFTIFLLPVGLLSATAALAWGWKAGGTIELVTCTITAIVPYVLARRGLAGWVERRISRERLPSIDAPFVHFLLRLLPIIPYAALNYIAGAIRIRPRDFVLTTLVGSIPSTFLFAYFVDTMAAGALGAATQAKIVGVCAAIALLAILVKVAATRFENRRLMATPPHPPSAPSPPQAGEKDLDGEAPREL